MININEVYGTAVAMKAISEIVDCRMNQLLKKYNITSSQSKILYYMDMNHEKDYSMKELEKAFHVSQQTMAGLISRMEEKGLVQSYTDKNDKRVKRIHLSEEGVKLMKTADKEMLSIEKQAMKGISDKEKDVLNMIMQKIQKNLVAE